MGAQGSSLSSPVIPVKEQPVHSLQLILPQLVAILILPGLLQFLPGLRCWALLGGESRGKVHRKEEANAQRGQTSAAVHPDNTSEQSLTADSQQGLGLWISPSDPAN